MPPMPLLAMVQNIPIKKVKNLKESALLFAA
jgi:hypothetical protein